MAIHYETEAYCGTELVSFIGQVAYQQLTGILSPGTLNNYTNGTLIPAAERIIDDYVGRREGTLRHFNPHGSVSWFLDGSGKSTVWTPPKYSPTLYVGDVWINGNSMSWVSPTNVKLYEQYLTVPGATFRKGDLNVKIYGTYGYIKVPKDIEYMTAQLCANVLTDVVRRRAADGVVSADFMTMATSLFGSPTVFTDDMRKRLSDYRIKWLDIG